MKKFKSSNIHYQKGVSKFGILMVFIMMISFVTAGLKVAPLYVDHNLITGICEELIENGEAANMTITDIRQRVSNSLRINNVTGFELSSIKLRRENNQPIITIAYERRIELFANLDVVAKFDTELQ
ncbi:MAG: hypothetical protein COA96_09155 [SAR86 cluster bacterium]|uniref:DUF4845 domain-containing protein n=1 Tax=SAR86 cluster bacterium TaxID=2030880 RepID=A0A2A5AZA8_9GAMM|nr:MAG: hypothetical protein COA96_09155 [SAR86 cluster bacterium]